MSFVVYAATSGNTYFWSGFFASNREVSGFLIILIYLALISVFAYLISTYISKLYRDENTWLTPVSGRIVSFFEKLFGDEAKRQMKFREYFTVLVVFNLFAGIIVFVAIFFQNFLPYSVANNHFNLSLTFNTVVSFLTNTDLQHYSNPSDLSYFSVTFGITGLMFLAAGTGFAASMAFVRGILTDKGTIGNFFHDFLVSIFYLILPLTLVVSLLLILDGVPQTIQSYLAVHNLIAPGFQYVQLGPVGTFEAIKNIGTNGGGFYGANAAYPFENPNWFSNILEVISFTIIPLGAIFALGKSLREPRFGRMLFTVIMVIFTFSAFLVFFSEYIGIPSMSNLGLIYTGNLLGKESYLGIAQSSIFSTGATITSTGAANGSLLNYTPAGLLGVMIPLLLNDPLGGVGTGVLNIFMYVIFTVFIASLIVGKLPELMSLRIGSKEIKYSTLSLITHPLLVMIPLGITLLLPHFLESFINSKSADLTSLLYEFGTSAANNGSEIGGFLTNQAYFNYLDGVIMILGRFLLIGFQLVIGQSFANKSPKIEFGRTIDPGSYTFAFLLLVIMVLLGLLSFFPALVLGPVLSWARDFNLLIGVIIR